MAYELLWNGYDCDCNKRIFLTESELSLYHYKGLAHLYSITRCLFLNKVSINKIVSFKWLNIASESLNDNSCNNGKWLFIQI